MIVIVLMIQISCSMGTPLLVPKPNMTKIIEEFKGVAQGFEFMSRNFIEFNLLRDSTLTAVSVTIEDARTCDAWTIGQYHRFDQALIGGRTNREFLDLEHALFVTDNQTFLSLYYSPETRLVIWYFCRHDGRLKFVASSLKYTLPKWQQYGMNVTMQWSDAFEFAPSLKSLYQALPSDIIKNHVIKALNHSDRKAFALVNRQSNSALRHYHSRKIPVLLRLLEQLNRNESSEPISERIDTMLAVEGPLFKLELTRNPVALRAFVQSICTFPRHNPCWFKNMQSFSPDPAFDLHFRMRMMQWASRCIDYFLDTVTFN